MAENKTRLDIAIFEQGFTESRAKAGALIMAGQVYVNGQKALKSGITVKATDKIEVRGEKMPFVSRGGYKLDKAVKAFSLDLTDCVCMDIGASTGGFTDCMLQNGAERVYAVDVGHGQLAWKLRSDERVVCMERTNFRYVTPEDIGQKIDFASVDVSFISLTKILIPARNLLRPQGHMVCLIKPQFEAGRDKVGKKGVIRDSAVHEEVIRKVVDYSDLAGFAVKGLTYSPIKGPEGNIEYLIYLEKRMDITEEIREMSEACAESVLRRIIEEKSGAAYGPDMEKIILSVVSDAHSALDEAR